MGPLLRTQLVRERGNKKRGKQMGRSPCCSKEGLNRGAWTALEDKILTAYIKAHGEGKWRNLPKRAGLRRCGKSCRLRWLNYLRPDIKRGNISHEEEELIIRLHKLLGNRWSLIAGRLPGRTDNEIKNYWNTILRKKANDQSSSSSPPKTPLSNSRQENKPIQVLTNESSIPQETQVIRSQASRCSKVQLVSLDSPPHPEINEASISAATNHHLQDSDDNSKFQGEADDDQWLKALIHEDYSEFMNFGYSDNNGDIQVLDNDYNESLNMVPDQLASLSVDNSTLEDWGMTMNMKGCLEDDATLDLDSLPFSHWSENWP